MRALPRAFVPGLELELDTYVELPKEEYDKFHKVLRLGTGDEVALLPNDGRLFRCTLQGRGCVPLSIESPGTETPVRLVLALALSKPDALESSVRMATEIGTAAFVLFPSDRSVVKWTPDKLTAKVERLSKIAREAAEVSYRTRLPEFHTADSLASVLKTKPEALVLSESESDKRPLVAQDAGSLMLVVGPEGGWSPREAAAIGDRAVTLGSRVLRVDTAVAVACGRVLSV